MKPSSWLGRALLFARLAGPLLPLLSCTSTTGSNDGPPSDFTQPMPVLFQDCTPGLGEQPCQAGLRCGLVQVGSAPYQGYLTQCVPVAASALPEQASCAFDQKTSQPAGDEPKLFDRCAAGLGCVPVPLLGDRCRALCPLQMAKVCSGDELCVIHSQVEGTGFCAAPDHCDPVTQAGCPTAPQGQAALNCYVLGDGEHTASFCLSPDPLGNSAGGVGDACERSVNCQGGLGCFDVGTATRCQPYCALPWYDAIGVDAGLHDGGIPDGGGGPVSCDNGAGTCFPISGYVGAGECQ